MQQSDALVATPATTSSTLDSWNQERSLEHLQQFIQGRLSQNLEPVEITI